MAVTNVHLEHLEDEIINNGIAGGRASINFLRELRDMLKGHATGRVKMTVKWDGAPAIFCGPHPETKEFYSIKNHYSTHPNNKSKMHPNLRVV
jgi:hypothetical protein